MRRGLNILMWAVIAIFTIATVIFCIWAGQQPRAHSIWAPETISQGVAMTADDDDASSFTSFA